MGYAMQTDLYDLDVVGNFHALDENFISWRNELDSVMRRHYLLDTCDLRVTLAVLIDLSARDVMEASRAIAARAQLVMVGHHIMASGFWIPD